MFAHFRFIDSPTDDSGKLGMSEMSFLARAIGLATVATAAFGAMSGARTAEPLFNAAPPITPLIDYTPTKKTPITFTTTHPHQPDITT